MLRQLHSFVRIRLLILKFSRIIFAQSVMETLSILISQMKDKNIVYSFEINFHFQA